MKPRQFVVGLIVILLGAAAIYGLHRLHRAPAADDEDESAAATVVSVQVGTLQPKTLHQYITGFGTVMPAPATAGTPAADAPLASPTAGVVAGVDVVEGQHVTKGELLLTLNSGTATAAYATAEAERQRQLYAQHNTSLKNLQDAETQLALLRVTAPLAGTVTRLNVKPGAAVDLSTVVAEIIDLDRLVVDTGIPEAEAPALRAGETVQVLTQPAAAAAVTYVSPTVDATDGTVRVRATLPPGSGLRPGQFVPLRIVTATAADCLAAPEEGVVTDTDGHSTIALVRGDHAAQTPVQTGFRENGWVQVSGPGLKAGDTIVTVGAYGLPDQTRIQVVNPAATPPAAPAAAAP